jgi:hypothetical protein
MTLGVIAMNEAYEKLSAFINNPKAYYSDYDAFLALPKLISALKGENIMATGGEIAAIHELILQIVINGFDEMDPDVRELFLPVEETGRQASRL